MQFEKFIVIHELFPGHYTQSKITQENPLHLAAFKQSHLGMGQTNYFPLKSARK